VEIAVTGIGAVSAAGNNAAALLKALENPKPRFGPSTRHSLGFEVTVAEAADSCFAEHNHPEMDTPTGRLCLKAARECVAHAASNGSGPPDGLCLGTSTGGQSENEKAVFGLLEGTPAGDFSYGLKGCMASPSRLVARDLKIFGPVRTVSTACTSSANALALGALWIESGKCDRVLAGGGDALCFTTLSSFHILDLTGPEPCTPFGPNRPGMTLGDGAGFLMLERLETVLSEGRTPLAVLLGFGMSSDAHHMTAPPEDGRGAALAISKALAHARLTPKDTAYVNAHGTGTRLNDAAEARAISEILDDVPVMSCKGITGHTLGGAGALEAAATVLSLCEKTAFENAGASEPAEDCPVRLIGKGGMPLAPNKAVISASFAFGGNNCVLVFGAAPGGTK
jgi:3-oxoacyl-[acyl-carrier-protein] synthase I